MFWGFRWFWGFKVLGCLRAVVLFDSEEFSHVFLGFRFVQFSPCNKLSAWLSCMAETWQKRRGDGELVPLFDQAAQRVAVCFLAEEESMRLFRPASWSRTFGGQ